MNGWDTLYHLNKSPKINSQSLITLHKLLDLEVKDKSCHVEISDKLYTIEGKSLINSNNESCLST